MKINPDNYITLTVIDRLKFMALAKDAKRLGFLENAKTLEEAANKPARFKLRKDVHALYIASADSLLAASNAGRGK